MCMEIDKISVISVHIYIYMWEYSTSSGYLSKQTIKDPQNKNKIKQHNYVKWQNIRKTEQ